MFPLHSHNGTLVTTPLSITLATIGVLGVATVEILQGTLNLKQPLSVTVGVLSKVTT
jgi:hypothetical protein